MSQAHCNDCHGVTEGETTFTIGHNFPHNTPGQYSEQVTGRANAAKALYDNYTPYYECEIFEALAKWLAGDDDTFELSFGEGDQQFTFYIEPSAN